MTILCLVRDKNGGGWAAFADCLITSDLQDQGFSLSTPMRPNYGTKKTFGFSEEALEEKIGLIEKDILLGWAGEKSEAVRALSEFKARQSDDEFTRIFANKKNCYLLIQRKEDGNSRIRFIGAEGHLHRIESCGYEFIFSGTGRKIIQDFRFTARGKLRLGENAPNAIWAALRAVARFFSEEMAGQTSQFYSLRTGGHYRIFYGSPKGIQQFYFAVNHWIMNEEHEPVVNSLVLPYVKDQYELSIEVKVEARWLMGISNAVAVVPLLESPRKNNKLEINLNDVLKTKIAECTFHICWQKDGHTTFVVNDQEPKFELTENMVYKKAHRERTLEIVREQLTQ